MRSQTGTSKMRKIGSLLCGAVASVTLTACTMTQPRTAMLRPPPYLALASNAGASASRSDDGYFNEEHGCIVFRTADGTHAMTPVFPTGSTLLVTDGAEWLGMYLNEAPVALGQMYRVHSSPEFAGGALPLVKPAPAGCPTSYVAVQRVGYALADNAHRLCSGVILCTSFRLN